MAKLTAAATVAAGMATVAPAETAGAATPQSITPAWSYTTLRAAERLQVSPTGEIVPLLFCKPTGFTPSSSLAWSDDGRDGCGEVAFSPAGDVYYHSGDALVARSRTGSLLWSIDLGGRESRGLAPVVATNGHIYALTSGPIAGASRPTILKELTPGGQVVRTIDFGVIDPLFFAAHRSGLVLVNGSGGEIRYLDLQGAHQSTYPFQPGDGFSFAVQPDGVLYAEVTGGGTLPNNCGSTGRHTLKKYAPSGGLQWTWPPTPAATCSAQTQATATPDGGVVVLGDAAGQVLDASGNPIRAITKVSATGVTQWTSPTGGTAGLFLRADDQGNVVGAFQSGLDIVDIMVWNSSGALSATAQLKDAAGGQWRGSTVAIGTDRIYLHAVYLNCGVGQCHSPRLLSFNAPGLGRDWRDVLLTPVVIPQVTVTPAEGLPGTTFRFGYSCPSGATARLSITDSTTNQPVTQGVTIGLPVTGNGRDYTQGVTVGRLGGYRGNLSCGGSVDGSALFRVTDSPADLPAAVGPGEPYVALGDSYSAGEGNAPFMFPTDETCTSSLGAIRCRRLGLQNGNSCHRSEFAYPQRVLFEGNVGESRTFRACAGAVIDDFYHVQGFDPVTNGDDRRPYDTERAQIVWLGPSTKYVTLTISGNDIGFAGILRACTYRPSAGRDRRTLNPSASFRAECDAAIQSGNTRLTDVRTRLASLYRLVLDRAPNAQVLVLNYPILFPDPEDYTGFRNQACEVSGAGRNYILDPYVERFRALNEAVNAAVSGALATASSGRRLLLADVASHFGDHSVSCGDGGRPTPWINGGLGQVRGDLPPVGLSNASFHPNRIGQCQMALLVNRRFGHVDPALRCPTRL